jgi:hypothetical protein
MKRKHTPIHSLDIVFNRINTVNSFYEGESYEQFLSFCDNVVLIVREQGAETNYEGVLVGNSRRWDNDTFVSTYEISGFYQKSKTTILFMLWAEASDNFPYTDDFSEWTRVLREREKRPDFLNFMNYGTRHYDVAFNNETYESYDKALEAIKAKLQELFEG